MMRTLALLLCMWSASAWAEDVRVGGPGTEPVDTTRLDVDRLPPEVLEARRALYSRGWLLEAQLGGVALAGDARQVSRGGPRFAIALGYELARWFAWVVSVEGSLHMTKNQPPPEHTSYELLMATLHARFSIPIDARQALFLSPQFGLAWTSRDVLRALQFMDAYKPGVAYGGELGYDFHLPSRHHSIGVLAGARQLPRVQRDGFTIAIHAATYLRYVF